MTPAENTEPQSTPETDDDGQAEEDRAEASSPRQSAADQRPGRGGVTGSEPDDGPSRDESEGAAPPDAAAKEADNGDVDPAVPDEDPPVSYDAVKPEHEPVDARTASEGQREVVNDPADAGRTFTDIDHVDDGVPWEEKSATWAGNEQKGVDKQVTQKLNAYLDARRHLPGYENAPIGVRFTELNLRRAVEGAVAKFCQDNPDVDVRLMIPE